MRKTYVIAPLLAISIGTSIAAEKDDAVQADLVAFSKLGGLALQDIRAARFAIFSGDTKSLSTILERAKDELKSAEADTPMFDIKTTMTIQGKVIESHDDTQQAKAVPVDGRIVLADDFVLTPEKKKHIAKANEHLKNSQREQALRQLKQGEVDVSYQRTWMPIVSSEKHVEQALKLAQDGAYYEANLALKAIEDSLTVDSITVTDLPKRAAK